MTLLKLGHISERKGGQLPDMTYSILTLGLPEKLITALQDLISQCDLNFIASATIRETSRLLEQQVFHLLIIGLDYLRNIHQTDWLEYIRHISFVPLIILSSTPDQDINTMVRIGADMCISGNYPHTEIASHAYAQIRRYTEYNHCNDPAGAETLPFQVGDIFIDPARQKVEVCGRPVNLRHREFSLLLYFMRNSGIVLSASQICENAWGMEYTQPIDRAIYELRKQIESNPRQPCYIQTVHRAGYRFTAYSSETCE